MDSVIGVRRRDKKGNQGPYLEIILHEKDNKDLPNNDNNQIRNNMR